jgi:putative tryptophan/tyrosine transport system substrate-binding protein
VRRREFIGFLSGAAVTWPHAVRAQKPTIPVVGLLSALSIDDRPRVVGAFQKGLNEAGYVEGRNVTIEYRFAEGHYDRLAALAADLVHRQVAVLAALSGTPTALAAKAATSTIPIVFAIGGDPVALGLVAALNRPEGNTTGVTFFTVPLATKRLEMVHQLAPKVTSIAVLVNPTNPPSLLEAKTVPAAALEFGLHATVFDASTTGQIDEAFAALAQQQIGAIYVSADPLFFNQRGKVAALAARYAVPATYADREIAEAGGLMSYGASRSDAYRQAGFYVGRILGGEKVADLPVVLPTRFELVLNLKAAKALSITVPPRLLALADEVIE